MQAELSRWCRQLNSLLMINSCIWDNLADKVDEALSEVGDAGSWLIYWWSMTTFVICWLIKLMMHWLWAAAFCFPCFVFCSVCNIAVFMKLTLWSFLDPSGQTVTIPKLWPWCTLKMTSQVRRWTWYGWIPVLCAWISMTHHSWKVVHVVIVHSCMSAHEQMLGIFELCH